MSEEPEIPRLSVSIAHKLTTESPLSAWAAHRLLGNFKLPPTTSQIEGRMWHAAILEDSHDVVVVEHDAFRSAEAKDERDNILALGQIPVTRPKYDALKPAARRIREELERHGITFGGTVEKRFEWTEYTDSGEPVYCSGYLDHFEVRHIDDVKSGSSPTSVHKAQGLIAKSRSLMQDAAYRSALSYETDIDPTEMDFVYSFVQTREPFSVTPVRMTGEFRELSHLRWRRAIHAWHECISKGTGREHWPDVVEGVGLVGAPGWMISHEIELEAMRDE